MNITSATIVQRLWKSCNVLHDDGMSYGDDDEQLTTLLFLKKDHENSMLLSKPSVTPVEFSWVRPIHRLTRSFKRCVFQGMGKQRERRQPNGAARGRNAVSNQAIKKSLASLFQESNMSHRIGIVSLGVRGYNLALYSALKNS